jgi:hypothetical protein
MVIDRVLEVVLPKVKTLIDQSNSVGRHGFIYPGTWDPKDGTATVVLSDTILPVAPDQMVTLTRVPIVSPHTGDQYGPIGDERVLVHRTQSGWSAKMIHDPFDSIGPPSGERWIFHRNPTTGTADLKVKMTNDGSVPGSGSGGLTETGASYYKRTTPAGNSDTFDDAPATKGITRESSSGHFLDFDDVAGQLHVRLQSSGGHYTIYDDVGRAIKHVTAGGLTTLANDLTAEISHIAPHIGLGDIVGNLDASAHAALNHAHLTTFENSAWSKRLDDLTKFAAAMVAAAVPNAGAVLAQLATLIHVPVPNGSAITLIKP